MGLGISDLATAAESALLCPSSVTDKSNPGSSEVAIKSPELVPMFHNLTVNGYQSGNIFVTCF